MTSQMTNDAEICENDEWLQTEIVKFVTQMMENELSEDIINKTYLRYVEHWIKIYHKYGKDNAHRYTPAMWNFCHPQPRVELNYVFEKNTRISYKRGNICGFNAV